MNRSPEQLRRARTIAADYDLHMAGHLAPTAIELADALRDRAFVFLDGERMRRALEAACPLDDLRAFTDSWERLEPDQFMADGGRYRRRRHATLAAARGQPAVPQPHQPHFQSVAYNALNGGIERWFAPIEEAVVGGATMRGLLQFGGAIADALFPAPAAWHVELHQFRIEARADALGQPTPEGLHRDGVDFVMVVMVQRTNIERGVTRIHGSDRAPVGSFTLEQPFDAALLDDHRVFHAVTPVEPLDPRLPAHRDVLVATWRAR
jgi:hypothetical protein